MKQYAIKSIVTECEAQSYGAVCSPHSFVIMYFECGITDSKNCPFPYFLYPLPGQKREGLVLSVVPPVPCQVQLPQLWARWLQSCRFAAQESCEEQRMRLCPCSWQRRDVHAACSQLPLLPSGRGHLTVDELRPAL